MADVDFDDFDGGYGTPLPGQAFGGGRWPHLLNIAGAVSSVVLVGWLAVWGYQLAVRDVNGVPVMRAMADPMRVAPADPEGKEMSYQGLSVNAVAATGIASPVPDQLALAPRPVELLPEDGAGLLETVAMAVPLASPLPGAAQPSDATMMATDDLTLAAPAAATTAAMVVDTDAVAAALAEAMAVGDAPAAAPGIDASGIDAPGIDATGIAEATSPRPMLRPSARPSAASATGSLTNIETVAAVAPVEIDPSTLAVGTRLVQLGAYDNTDEARLEWVRLQTSFADLMAGKAMVIQEAQSGGRTFFRLRAHGFETEEESRRFCAALLVESGVCIPVAQR